VTRAVAATLVVLARVASAEPADVTIDRAVALYREHNPRLAAARAGIDVTAADLVDADIYPNPTLAVEESVTVHGAQTNGDALEQAELDVPILVGKRGQRAETASRRVAATRAEVAVDAAAGVREVRRRFVALLAAQERVAALGIAVEDARRVRTIVAGRAQAGAKSPYDLERTDLAVATITSRLAEATTDQLEASAQLAEAVGIVDWQPHAVGSFRPATTPAPAVVDAAHPELARPRTAEARANAEEELAHTEARPTPNLVIAGYDTHGPAGIGLTVGIAIPLPVFDRNQGAVARAHASAQAAALERAAAAFELRTSLERGSKILAARRDALAKFEADAMDRLPKLRTMAEDAYRSGQGGIVELLDALDAITETRLRDIDLVASVLDTELDVRAAATGD
jgi:cobalt-zinc-cadmium efflux system outer membrane protein